jgi:predicted O-linked N-acetylglucosamine transferase (SPINDLY family)
MFKWFKESSPIVKEASGADTQGIELIDQRDLIESEALKDQGNSLVEKGELEAAADCYRQAIALNPRYAEANTNLGLVFQLQGNLIEAVAHYRKAIEVNPDLIIAQQNLGFALLNLGQIEAAEQSLRRVVALDPVHYAALQSLGAIAAQSGNYAQAETLWRRTLEIQPDLVDALNNLATLLKHTNQLSEVETIYRRLLVLQPDNINQHLNLGNLLFSTRRLDEAEACYLQALELGPNLAEIHCNLACLQMELQRLPEAEVHLRRAIELKPELFSAHNNMGNLLMEQALLPEAEASYRRALELNANDSDTHFNLGNLLFKLKRLTEAEAFYRGTLKLRADYAVAHYSLGNLLMEVKRLPEAEACYRNALQVNPDYPEVLNCLGNLLTQTRKLTEAEAYYRNALKLKPEYAEAHNNLGNLFVGNMRPSEAEACFRRALELNPGLSEAHSNLGLALSRLGRFEEAELSIQRALQIKPDFAEGHCNYGDVLISLGRLREAAACYRRALEIKPDYTEAYSNLLFSMNYTLDTASLHTEEARRYGMLVTQKAGFHFSSWQCPVRPNCLRVGMVSGDLCEHPVGFFLEGLLSNIDSNRIELYAYPTYHKIDELTARIKHNFVSWKPLLGLSDEAAAKMIHEDGIDILMDLSGHTAHNRLPVFAWKPAPVQVSWLGYFATTGVVEIDYVIADPYSFRETEQIQFTEEIWHLPETRCCFTAPKSAVQISPLPALNNHYVTFACFNNLNKMSDTVVAVWAKILDAVPGSRLFLKAEQLNKESARQVVIERFAAHGVAADRLILEGYVPRVDYLAAYQRVDIALDPFPYTGGTTSAEAMWMGIPVLTLAGDRIVSRQGVSLLMNAGLPDWIAADVEEYAARAVAHAGSLNDLASLRSRLRQQVLASPIFDSARFARHFESALFEMREN